METYEKPPEAVKKEGKKAEKKPERKFKLPETAADYMHLLVEKEKSFLFSPQETNTRETLEDLGILSSQENPSSKHNKLLKSVLFNVLKAKSLGKGTDILSKHSEESVEYLHKSVDDFFSPIVNRGENEKKLEEYNKEKEELVSRLNWINQNPMFSKEEKKKERAPIENRLLELSRLRKQIEERIKLKSAEKLLYLIPGYQKDFDEHQERIKEMHPSESLKESLENDFNEKWVAEKLEKKLEKLRKDLEKMI
jgi:hypothetical protein